VVRIDLLEHVHEDRALYGITYQAAVQEQPGHVRHSSAGERIVGGATADALDVDTYFRLYIGALRIDDRMPGTAPNATCAGNKSIWTEPSRTRGENRATSIVGRSTRALRTGSRTTSDPRTKPCQRQR
jgi:hypothetical protein